VTTVHTEEKGRTMQTSYRWLLAVVAFLTIALAALTVLPARADLPAGASITAEIPVDDASGMVDVGFGSVWVSNTRAGTVSRIDPTTDTVVGTIAVGRGTFGLRTGDGAVWLTNSAEGTVLRIDPATNLVVATIPVGTFPIGLAVTPGAVWIANHWAGPGETTGSVSRIDPTTNTVVDTIPLGVLPFAGPKFVAAGAGSIWVGVPNLEAVVRISTATDAIQATIADKGSCSGIAATDTAVWIAGGNGPGCAPGVTRIDPASNTLVGDKINAGGNVADVAAGAHSVWYTAPGSQFVGRIDPGTSTVASMLKVRGSPTGIAVGFGAAWVLDPEHGLVLRLRPA
jgi:YVTN family beta-propeller protein